MTDPTTSQQQNTAGSSAREVAAIILAAGKSTRMRTDLPKVMQDVCGRPMLAYVLDACRGAGVSARHVVVGFGKDAVTKAFSTEPGIRFVEQVEQNGTGHAVAACAEAFQGFLGDVIVIAGDMPMIKSQTLRTLLEGHRASASEASIATTVLDDPTGYGRIIRDAEGRFQGIVEHRDCSSEQLEIKEVNPSYYCFDARALFNALPEIKADNAKGELYLTDVLAVIGRCGRPVLAATSVPADDAMGINSPAELALVAGLMQRRIQQDWMAKGVTIIDPRNTWIDSRARIGPQTVIKPFTYVEGNAQVGSACTVGPFSYLAAGTLVEDGTQTGPGVLSALDTAGPGRRPNNPGEKPEGQVVRRPPVRTGCS
jgi:bifunctional UDP-N-acetylglucosamine pyrophosphorylase/glucosamine-1-phosphate N-acetyltransferase